MLKSPYQNYDKTIIGLFSQEETLHGKNLKTF